MPGTTRVAEWESEGRDMSERSRRLPNSNEGWIQSPWGVKDLPLHLFFRSPRSSVSGTAASQKLKAAVHRELRPLWHWSHIYQHPGWKSRGIQAHCARENWKSDFLTYICPKLDNANAPTWDLEVRFKHGIEAKSHLWEKSPKEHCASAVNKWVNAWTWRSFLTSMILWFHTCSWFLWWRNGKVGLRGRDFMG